jgi:hypothetical protein
MNNKHSLQCSAMTKGNKPCYFKGLHMVNGKRYCGNHAAIARAYQKVHAIAKPPKEPVTVIATPLFGPTQESLKIAKEAMGMDSEIAIAYMIDGFVANALRKANQKD